MSYIRSLSSCRDVVLSQVVAEHAPRRGTNRLVDHTREEPCCWRITLWSRVSASRRRLDLGELMSSKEKPRNAELRGEVASRQASPRRSMSTNTLRMVVRW
jgi:hypothetical protein